MLCRASARLGECRRAALALRWASSSTGASPTATTAAAPAIPADAAPKKAANVYRIDQSAPAAGWDPAAPLPVSFGDVSEARYRIRTAVPQTPVRRSRKLSQLFDSEIWFKDEFMMPTGSFKERGARNALMKLGPQQRKEGVIAASAGNHASALAFHGRELGIPVTVAMPKVAPLTKIQICRELGATVLLEGNHLGETRTIAEQIGRESGLTYINGYDHPDIIAGAGTMGLEILEQVPSVEAVVVPVGGAGLIAGVALAIKTLHPACRVIGVEPANVASLVAAWTVGHPEMIAPGPTIADGLLVPKVGDNAFRVARKHVDEVIAVEERHIALAMLRLMEAEKCVVEGGGATGFAAMIAGKLSHLQGKRVLFPLCGGNVDTVTIHRVIDRGLAADGRLIQFNATVSDRPGGIAGLTKVLADAGVSIRDIFHERAWVQADTSTVKVKIVAETSGPDHARSMFEVLHSSGFNIEVDSHLWTPKRVTTA